MQKNATTINFTKASLTYINNEATTLGLTNSTFVESVIMTHAFENGFIPTSLEIDNLRKSFLVNSYSNLTGDFRDQISTFSPAGQIAIIALFYRLNLINGFKISTRIMANMFKHEELCYFALGRIGRSQQLVNDYLRSYSLNIATIGSISAHDSEYIFFSNYQQFKIKKSYPKFTALLIALALPQDTEVIRVHYSELTRMSDAISSI